MADLHIAICEDDNQEYDLLSQILKESSVDVEWERFSDGPSFLAQFYQGRYDLILMDIYMTGMTGVEAVSHIREQDSIVPIAFITTSLDHAMDGYRYHVNRYLQKPLRREDIEEVLLLALKEQKNAPGVQVRTPEGQLNVPFSHIRYVEQVNHDLNFMLTGGRVYSMRGKLDEVAPRFPAPPFFRCHKSYLVNLSQIKRPDRELCVFEMNEGGMAYIRRDSLKEALSAYERYMFDQVRRSGL